MKFAIAVVLVVAIAVLGLPFIADLGSDQGIAYAKSKGKGDGKGEGKGGKGGGGKGGGDDDDGDDDDCNGGTPPPDKEVPPPGDGLPGPGPGPNPGPEPKRQADEGRPESVYWNVELPNGTVISGPYGSLQAAQKAFRAVAARIPSAIVRAHRDN